MMLCWSPPTGPADGGRSSASISARLLMIADRADWWPPEPGPGAEDAETAVTTSALGLILLTGAAVVLTAIVAARVAHGPGHPRFRRRRCLARPDRPVRHARAARLSGPAARAAPARRDSRD